MNIMVQDDNTKNYRLKNAKKVLSFFNIMKNIERFINTRLY